MIILTLPVSVTALNNCCTAGSKSSLAVLMDGQVKWTKSVYFRKKRKKQEHQ